jgi:hypothetical protein
MLRSMQRLAGLCALMLLLGCSSSNSGPSSGDGSALGGSSGGNDAAPDTTNPCLQPLSQNTVCEPSFDMQVADNPCDPAMVTQAMCGRYRVWTSVFVGSDICVYDTGNNGVLVGARSCGTLGTPAMCGDGSCIDFGISPSQYATCGAETTACPP